MPLLGALPVTHHVLPLNDRNWSRWLVHAHHPDWLRAPEPSPGRVQEDRARAALTWNTFVRWR